ncbi:hypothetical protein ACOSP7_029372 [Xanthoceras sorbifolium]
MELISFGPKFFFFTVLHHTIPFKKGAYFVPSPSAAISPHYLTHLPLSPPSTTISLPPHPANHQRVLILCRQSSSRLVFLIDLIFTGCLPRRRSPPLVFLAAEQLQCSIDD